MGHKMDGWMDDFRFYVLFNSISVISGQCLDDNERQCAMELGHKKASNCQINAHLPFSGTHGGVDYSGQLD